MKNWLLIFVIICDLVVLSSCKKKEVYNVPVEKLLPEISYQKINDSIFLSNIVSIECIQNQLFLTDMDQHVIICLDTNLKYVQTIGGKGHGPGELLYPLNVFETTDGITVLDAGNRRLNTYLKKGNHYSFNDAFATNLLINENRSMLFKDNVIFLVTPNKEPLFKKINLFSHDTISFGKFYPKITDVERNFRRILLNSKNLFSVGVSEPIIEVFSLSGNV